MAIRRNLNLDGIRNLITFLQPGGGYALGTVDSYHLANRTSAFGELLTVQPQPHTAWSFGYGINTDIVSTTVANNGTVTGSNSLAVLATGTNAAGSAVLSTINRLRYLPGLGGLVRFTAIFTRGVANSRQLIGVGDAADGFFFGYNGATFGILYRRNSIDTWIPQSQWNGDAIEFTPTMGNIYQIRYQWLGFGRIHFYILDPQNDIGYVNVHTIHYPNQNVGVSILNPTLPIYAQVLNSGNASNVMLSSPSAVGFTEGQSGAIGNPLDVYRSRDASATFADTNNNHLLTIRNKSTFNSLTNRLPVLLRSLSIGRGSAGAATSSFRLYRNATTADALSYTDVSATNSPVEYSATTTTITSTDPIATFNIAEGNLIIPYSGEIKLQPGDTLSIGVQDSTAPGTVVAGTLNWVEQF